MTPETAQAIIFYGLAAVVLISCAIVVFAQSIVHSVFALFFTLMAVAGFYALLAADWNSSSMGFLAVTQVVVYVGGILALLLFGILLTSRTPIVLGLTSRRTYLLATLAGAIVFAILMVVVLETNWAEAAVEPDPEPTVARLGRLLLTDYLFAFEFASLTLLAALIGAAYLVRRDDR